MVLGLQVLTHPHVCPHLSKSHVLTWDTELHMSVALKPICPNPGAKETSAKSIQK